MPQVESLADLSGGFTSRLWMCMLPDAQRRVFSEWTCGGYRAGSLCHMHALHRQHERTLDGRQAFERRNDLHKLARETAEEGTQLAIERHEAKERRSDRDVVGQCLASPRYWAAAFDGRQQFLFE